MNVATIVVTACEAWLAIGAFVGLWFVVFAIDRIDPAAHGAYAFRPLLLPGLALLWPIVVWRWRRLSRDAPAGGA